MANVKLVLTVPSREIVLTEQERRLIIMSRAIKPRARDIYFGAVELTFERDVRDSSNNPLTLVRGGKC